METCQDCGDEGKDVKLFGNSKSVFLCDYCKGSRLREKREEKERNKNVRTC
jgi:hypothetical protein